MRMRWPVLILLLFAIPARGQTTQGSRNVSLEARIPLAANGPSVAVSLDQDRDLAYVAHATVVSIVDIDTRRVHHTWTPEGGRITDIVLFGPETIAVASERGIRVARISDDGQVRDEQTIEAPSLRALAAYRHSRGGHYLLGSGRSGTHLISSEGTTIVALPEDVPGRERGAFGAYAAYDLASETDRLYVAGAGGYFVFDITDPAAPDLLTWVNSAAVQTGIRVQASPDATQIVTSTNYDSAPLRIFDLRPALDGTISQVRTASGAWTADWRSHAQQFELRWPYVFVAARDQGFEMFNLRNAYEPYTTAWFRTAQPGSRDGAIDIDVRNADGLVAVLDAETGLWLIRVEDFLSWDGRGWGMGNISAVQNWENGPVGSDRW